MKIVRQIKIEYRRGNSRDVWNCGIEFGKAEDNEQGMVIVKRGKNKTDILLSATVLQIKHNQGNMQSCWDRSLRVGHYLLRREFYNELELPFMEINMAISGTG